MSDALIAKWLDDRRSLDDAEAAELLRLLSADPVLRQNVREVLSVDDLVARRLGVDRRNFEKQVAQRLLGSGSEGSFLKSTLDAVAVAGRRRASWRTWIPEVAAAAVLVAGLLLLLLRREETPAPSMPAAPPRVTRGLHAEYYPGQRLEGKPIERLDATPDFRWDGANPPIPVPKGVYSVRWTAKVTPTVSGRTTLHARYDDGIRVWWDGKLVIDDWNGRYVVVDRSSAVDLEAGRAYDLKIEYFNGGGRGVMQLFWSCPGRPEEILPLSALSTE